MTLRLDVAGVTLDADVAIPAASHGVVLFAHGSGSSRHSTRNRLVADVLERAGFGTVLVDLLVRQDEDVFDIDLLAGRLTGIVDWLTTTHSLPIGLFGASTGAAAALVAAARRPERVGALVSRGGRPDLAGPALPLVHAPVLLIVGDRDHPVVELNQAAAAQLGGINEVVLVPGATHLFEEPGALEQVADLATNWFARHLTDGKIGA